MKTMTVAEFHEAIEAQGVPKEHFSFICPQCGTVQSADDLIKAGAGENFDDIQNYLGFSCVGRFTGAGSPLKENDGEPCNWTLGGLFFCHKLEVVDDEGEHHPHFEPATKGQALVYMIDKLMVQA